MVCPSLFSLIQMNVTKLRLEGEIVWILFVQWTLAFIIVIGYREHDQDGGNMVWFDGSDRGNCDERVTITHFLHQDFIRASRRLGNPCMHFGCMAYSNFLIGRFGTVCSMIMSHVIYNIFPTS